MFKKHKSVVRAILITLLLIWYVLFGNHLFKIAKVYINVYLHHKEMEEYAIKCKEDHKYVNRYIDKTKEYAKEDFRYFVYEYEDDSHRKINRYYKKWEMWICDNENGQYIVKFDISGWGLVPSGAYLGAIYSPDDIDVFCEVSEGYYCEKTTHKIMKHWYFYKIEY